MIRSLLRVVVFLGALFVLTPVDSAVVEAHNHCFYG